MIKDLGIKSYRWVMRSLNGSLWATKWKYTTAQAKKFQLAQPVVPLDGSTADNIPAGSLSKEQARMKMEFCWLLEVFGPGGSLYLHAARGDGVCGFTGDPCDAQKFATKELAEAERVVLNGALGAVPVEHGFIS